jgi:regulatory protein
MSAKSPKSPNIERGCLRIDSVREGSSGSTIVEAGGASFSVLPAQLEKLAFPGSLLVPGRELDESQAAALALAAEAREAERRGLALLARAEQSSFMLRMKLEAREFSRRAVALALERLAAEGLLDDRRFASAYAASRLAHRGSKAEGPASLVAALRERGVDRSLAAEAVAELLGPEERPSALASAASKELKRSGGDRGAARRRLRSLGFSSEEISDLFETI